MHRKRWPKRALRSQTFIMPFFSCIMTECRKAVAVIQGSRKRSRPDPRPSIRPPEDA